MSDAARQEREPARGQVEALVTDEDSHIAFEHEQSLVLPAMHVHGRLGVGGALGLDLAETIVGLFPKTLIVTRPPKYQSSRRP